ncbi:MAG: hypothetical protein WCL02_07640 [bacterium]
MHHEALLYSLDPKITFAQVQNISEYDRTKYTHLQERATENNVCAMLASDTNVHYKILPIRPRVQLFYYIGDISLLNKKILGIV